MERTRQHRFKVAVIGLLLFLQSQKALPKDSDVETNFTGSTGKVHLPYSEVESVEVTPTNDNIFEGTIQNDILCIIAARGRIFQFFSFVNCRELKVKRRSK